MRRFPVLVLLLLLASCSDGQITKTEGDVRIWLHESGFAGGGEDALLWGTMTYDFTTRCMFLEDGVGKLNPVIWPSGTRIESVDPVTLKAKGEVIVEGDSVVGGGGAHQPRIFDGLIPPECYGSTSQVIVFNADSRIEVNRP